MADLIDRQAAIDAVEKNACNTQRIMDAVNNLPTIQPQSITGQLNDGAQSTAQSTDLIERQATIDAVNNAFDRETLLAVFVRSIAVRAIRDMPSAQPSPPWIPVSERLPETEEFVLASLTGKYRNTTFEHACEIADYADGEWCVYAYPHMSAEKCAEIIEAWIPLPEAYKPNK